MPMWRRSRGDISMIHIAAHGEANRRSPLDSALILSPGDRGFKLYARDVMQVPLRADLVTISACRSSGARTYAGEGLVGLARAFLQAGAGSVIAGLWDLPDQSTSEMMDRMYQQIAAGVAPGGIAAPSEVIVPSRHLLEALLLGTVSVLHPPPQLRRLSPLQVAPPLAAPIRAATVRER